MADITDLPEFIKKSPITEFILGNVPQVDLADSLSVALKKYKESPYPVLLVVDKTANGSLVGMVTDNDLTGLIGIDGAGLVGALLPKDPVIAIKQNATLSELLEILNGINTQKRLLERVPVVDPQNKPLGIVDRDKLTIRLGEMLAAAK